MASKRPTLLTTLMVVTAVIVAYLMQGRFDTVNVLMVYMLAVVASAVFLGLWPSIGTCLVAVLLFDFFNVPPYFAFSRSEYEQLFTLLVMLVTAGTISTLADRLRQRVAESEERATRMASLYALAAELAGDLAEEAIVAVTARHLARTLPAAIDLPCDRGVAGLRDALTDRRGDDHVQAMLRLADQARDRAVLRERVRASELRAQQESLRSSIFGAVSHDLRTPLAAILGASSSLLDMADDYAPEARQRLRRVVYEEALQMKRMVENLLDFARLRSGVPALPGEWQAIEEIVGSALASLRNVIGGHRLVVAVPANLPLLRCNGVLIERVITNLVENAVKFSPEGSAVTLAARVAGDKLELTVEDEGEGIPEALREKVFEPFVRFGSRQGSGLGLALCRAIVVAHGGTLGVESSSGVGARFVVRLPLTAESPTMPAQDEEARPNG